MRLFSRIAVVVLMAAVVAFVIGGMLAPDSLHVEREIDIPAKSETVYALVSELRRWSEWSPWHEDEPTMVVEYDGLPEGVGAEMRWDSKKNGKGRQRINVAERDTLLRSSIDFEGRGRSQLSWYFEGTKNGVRVRWEFHTDFGGNYAARYGGLAAKRYVERMMERGLKNLSARAQAIEAKADKTSAEPNTP